MRRRARHVFRGASRCTVTSAASTGRRKGVRSGQPKGPIPPTPSALPRHRNRQTSSKLGHNTSLLQNIRTIADTKTAAGDLASQHVQLTPLGKRERAPDGAGRTSTVSRTTGSRKREADWVSGDRRGRRLRFNSSPATRSTPIKGGAGVPAWSVRRRRDTFTGNQRSAGSTQRSTAAVC